MTRFCDNCECEFIMKKHTIDSDFRAEDLNAFWKIYGMEDDANLTGDGRELKHDLQQVKQCKCSCHIFPTMFEP